MNRRTFLASMAGAAWLGGGTPSLSRGPTPIPDYEQHLFNLGSTSSSPVVVSSIELLRNGSHYFVRSRSKDGAVGVARTKQIEDYVPILLRRVAPFFLGKDARDLESQIDGVYIQNYKMAGQALWCPVAYVELSLLDLLGKVAGKPLAELAGGVIRRRIPVYLSGSRRDTTAEQEVEIYARGVEETGAKAIKLKIGGRMSRNRDVYPGRSEKMLALARERLGEEITIYADANGSYDSKKGIEMGRRLESLGVGFFEEPCPWEELSETKRVADALEMPVAAGEQDASLWRFHWMIENRVMDIAQPDINYNGGFIRTARVARMARAAGMPIVPHNTQTGVASVNILQFASCIPNLGPFIEYPYRGPRPQPGWYAPHFKIEKGMLEVPQGPGLGVEIDPGFLSAGEKVTA